MIIELLWELVPVEGTITLPVIVGSTPRRSQVQLTFIVVKILSTYNAIFDRSGLNTFHVILSTYCVLMRFPTLHGVRKVRRNQALVR